VRRGGGHYHFVVPRQVHVYIRAKKSLETNFLIFFNETDKLALNFFLIIINVRQLNPEITELNK
jgi:hypothetical protein